MPVRASLISARPTWANWTRWQKLSPTHTRKNALRLASIALRNSAATGSRPAPYMSKDSKTGHLVAYGAGGIWAYIYARSKDEIARKFPKLNVADERPRWMSEETFGLITSTNAFDIDA